MSVFLDKRIKALNRQIEFMKSELSEVRKTIILNNSDIENNIHKIIDNSIEEITHNRNLIAKELAKTML